MCQRFLTATLNFLMVGHTHEDVDQLFGLVVSLVLQRFKFQTPKDLVDHLEASLRARVQAKGEELHVSQLHVIRDFSRWVEPVHRELYNALATREGIEAPHSFSMKLRDSLAPVETAMAQPAPGVPVSPQDVMCVVKTYMRDKHPQQAPVCAIPAGRAAGVGPRPMQHHPMTPLTARQIEDYTALAQELANEWDAPEAAAALHTLVRGEHPEDIPRVAWLESMGLPEQAAVLTGHPFFPHLPATSWRLLVRDV
jgi:hypothetical protein